MPLFAPYPTKSKTIPVSKKKDQEILQKKIFGASRQTDSYYSFYLTKFFKLV
jgi:hypothetical protein